MMLPCQEGTGGNLKSAIRGCLLSDRHIHRINFMRVEFSPADGPKPDSLALRPALVDLGPAPRSIRQFGLEDQMPFRPGLPQASGRLWIARTQEPSPPDARNTACQSLYFPVVCHQRRRYYAGIGHLFQTESTKVNLRARVFHGEHTVS